MDMEDIYYNKYIKYKTKYLELKEQSGSGGLNITKIFNPNLNLYGSKYYRLVECLIKTKVIKEIIITKDVDYIKNKILIHKDINSIQEQGKDDMELLENFVDDDIKKIIKKSKLDIVKPKNQKDIRVRDIIRVLNDIESVLSDDILPSLYLKFEGKLQEEDLEKKLGVLILGAERIQKKLKAEIEAQIKVQDNNKKKIYKTNIDNIIKVYNIFCDIKIDYNNYYYSNNNKIVFTKENIKKKIKENNELLLEKLGKIQPKVELLIEVVQLYFFILEYYIENDIMFFPYHEMMPTKIQDKDNIYEKERFIKDIGDEITSINELFYYKVYENVFYGDDGTTLTKLNEFYNNIKSFNAQSDRNINIMKDNLVNILIEIKDNIILINNKVGNKFQRIIENINKNYDDISSIKKFYITNKVSHIDTKWFEYYEKNKELFTINFFPLLLKKSINIYLYQIFNVIITPSDKK